MAQKQFKIGLSNTDKQNMAQDVYERLLALTFPEYETTESYEIGDFVVYNDQLYKCIGATSGAWDSSKWQLATLNDLLTDIENAVAFVNDKANVNGNYPTMTVGFADNLTPYDESAGDDQDEPFILQATGTGNGTQPDFSTGSGALLKEKQGNTVVVNEVIKNNFFSSTSDWSTNASEYCTLAVSNNIATITILSTNTANRIQQDITFVSGHKYFVSVDFYSSKQNQITVLLGNVYLVQSQTNVANQWNNYKGIVSAYGQYFRLYVDTSGELVANDTVQIRNVVVIDLTQWFNGDIPQDLLDNPSNFFRYYQGSLAYNTGELVNANGRYIKCIGMNQWDEVAEQGTIGADGQNTSSNSNFRSKNYIKVIPNASYYLYYGSISSTTVLYYYFYDANKEFISSDFITTTNKIINVPSNAAYLRFRTGGSAPQSSYANDISINLYYEDEPRCLTYEPYQVLTNNDTGTEVLRSAGSVKDSKAPDGTITRRIGVVDLGTLTWTYNNTYGFWEAIGQVSNRKTADGSTVGNILCSNYGALAWNSVVGGSINGIASPLEANRGFIVRNGSSTTEPSGTLFYELAEPITEQGTSYSENLVIDDFGSMDFGSDVPQGALIFYPVDYKAFVDTLYKYTDGTPSNIALKSDVASEQSAREAQDNVLLNAVGGTLRQCLCVKESLDFDNTAFVDLGTLNWLYSTLDDTPAFTSGVALADLGANKKSICSEYSSQDGYQTTNKTYSLMRGENGTIWVIDNSYTDATAFKNAMKGVLIAYEKASE